MLIWLRCVLERSEVVGMCSSWRLVLCLGTETTLRLRALGIIYALGSVLPDDVVRNTKYAGCSKECVGLVKLSNNE